jgi:predicted phosphoribosyltransferase
VRRDWSTARSLGAKVQVVFTFGLTAEAPVRTGVRVRSGATVRACIAWARARGARRVVVGLPVAPRDTLAVLQREADAVVCLSRPLMFRAVGWAYDEFGSTDPDLVTGLLAGA